jgi:sugar/nucleoside kinase (ribokinase family)
MKLGRTLRAPSSARFDFVAFGENSLDTVALSSSPIASARKIHLRSLVELPGGQAATAAVCCARLGWRSRYVGVVGDDAAGRRVRDSLSADRVETVVLTRTGGRTRRAIVIVDESSGDRLVLHDRDPALDLAPGEIPESVFADARILLVDGSDPDQSIRAAQAARAAGVRTLVDVDRAGARVADLLALIDVVIVPGEVVLSLSGVPELGRGLAVLGQETGAAAVIATLGAAGAVAWAGGREVSARVNARSDVRVVDTTGAGDAFRAGFAAAWLGRDGADPDLEDLLADANLVAGLNCRQLGAQSALPTPDEVSPWLRGPV